MTKLTTEVRLSDSTDWQELLTVMAQHLDELPAPVRQGLEALSNGEALVWDIEYLKGRGVNPAEVTVAVNGRETSSVTAGLPLRRGYIDYRGNFELADSFTISHEGKVLAGW